MFRRLSEPAIGAADDTHNVMRRIATVGATLTMPAIDDLVWLNFDDRLQTSELQLLYETNAVVIGRDAVLRTELQLINVASSVQWICGLNQTTHPFFRLHREADSTNPCAPPLTPAYDEVQTVPLAFDLASQAASFNMSGIRQGGSMATVSLIDSTSAVLLHDIQLEFSQSIGQMWLARDAVNLDNSKRRLLQIYVHWTYRWGSARGQMLHYNGSTIELFGDWP